MQPLLATAVAGDKELEGKVLSLFEAQTTMPKSSLKNPLTNEDKDNDFGKVHLRDEVEFCIRLSTEQLPQFKRKSKVIELCY
jgi:hypothetical protein